MNRGVAFLILLTACAVGATAQSTPPAAGIALLIETELKAARVPGAAIAVVSGDERLARGFGVADAGTGAAMEPETLVHLGSLTKIFTALAVESALERQRLAPDTPIGPYVRGLGSRAAASTFRQLLSQTSGLRDRPGDSGSDDESALGEAARALVDRDFLLPAGTVFSYTNLGYALAGAALEGLQKRPYADAMRETVFAPLGMSRSTIRVAEASKGAHAIGHRLPTPPSETLAVVRPIANDTRIWPAGYMWSSAADMSRALFALMHDGRVDGKPAIPSAVVTRVLSPQTPMPNVFVGGHYGDGVMIARDRGVLMYEHGGTLPGFSSIVRFAPERGVGIAILSNLDNAPLRRIAQNVLAKALALPAPALPMRTETAVTVEEMKPLAGVYRNRGTAEIAVRDGQVVLILDEGPPLLVSRIDRTRYLASPKPGVPGPEFVLQPASGSTPAYLHFALWAYVRE